MTRRLKEREDRSILDELLLEGCSLSIFGEENRFRQALFLLVTHRRFEQTIICFIALASI